MMRVVQEEVEKEGDRKGSRHRKVKREREKSREMFWLVTMSMTMTAMRTRFFVADNFTFHCFFAIVFAILLLSYRQQEKK